jgi:hypothetical protein
MGGREKNSRCWPLRHYNTAHCGIWLTGQHCLVGDASRRQDVCDEKLEAVMRLKKQRPSTVSRMVT